MVWLADVEAAERRMYRANMLAEHCRLMVPALYPRFRELHNRRWQVWWLAQFTYCAQERRTKRCKQ